MSVFLKRTASWQRYRRNDHHRFFYLVPGAVTIPAGSSSAVVSVVPNDDKVKEDSETVELTLAASPAYQVGVPDRATVTILDND